MDNVSNIIGRCLGDHYYPLKLKKRGGNQLWLGTKHLLNFSYKLLEITAIILIFISCARKDKEPPYVEIVSPKDSSLFYGNLKVEVLVVDSSKIRDVLIYLNDNLFDTDTSYPYEFNIKFDIPFTWYKLFAKAYDIYNNEGISKKINIFTLGKERRISITEIYI